MSQVLFSIARIALLGALSASAVAATVEVGTCKSGLAQFKTIQAAVNAASSGDTVIVCPGSYAEQVVINKALTLRGIRSGTADAAIVIPPAAGVVQNATSLVTGNPIAAQVLVQATGDVNLSNITVDGGNNGLSPNSCSAPNLIGIYYQNTSGSVTRVAAVNQTMTPTNGCQNGLGIFVQSGGAGTSTVVISDSHVQNYQKNGITGNEVGTTVSIRGNTVVGQGPTNGAAENSIQIGFGAAGSITDNTVIDDIWAPDSISDSADAASGILVYASSGVSVSGNTVGNTQFGIGFVTDSLFGSADGGTITSNKITATRIFDGIELCNNNNTVRGNTIQGSDESAIHIDSICANFGGPGNSGSGNTISRNVINDACAGIMTGTLAGANTIGKNTFFNVGNTILTADQCTPPSASVRPLASVHSSSANPRREAKPARP